jgi:hypothetical protein
MSSRKYNNFTEGEKTMSGRKYSDEQRKKVIEMYVQGIPVREIANKMEIPGPSISAIVNRAGLPLRRPKVNKRILQFCGTDIRSEKDLTVEALQKLLYVILALPQGIEIQLATQSQRILIY